MQETAVRFAICDDDKVYAEKMKALILQTFHLPQPVECVIYLNQEQILKCYREDKIDIVFMDIEFGDTIGFQVARRLSMQDSQLAVVYMTNYEHYITEAFVCRPLGFIRKSHAEDDLQIAGQEIRRFIGQKYSRFVFGGGMAVVEVPLYKVYAVEIYGHDMVILLADENIRVRDKLMRVEDELELKTGQREDGTVYAVYSFARKVGQAFAGGAGGFALEIIGYQSAAAVQTQTVIQKLYTAATLIPSIGFFIVAAILWFLYPLDRETVAQNEMRLLEHRAEK